eukprot:6926711-Ditylum_brightwellii.AAC.1
MEELATTNRELSEVNKSFAEQLKMLIDSIKHLTQKVESSIKKKLPQIPRPTGTVNWDPIGFCWSCGWKVDKCHNRTRVTAKNGPSKGCNHIKPYGGV